MTENQEYLLKHGPSPFEDLPGRKLTVEDKMAGIWKFYGNWSPSSVGNTGGQTDAVCYLRDRHTPRQVVRAWIHANPRAVESLSKHSLIEVLNRNGSEFREPIRNLVRKVKA